MRASAANRVLSSVLLLIICLVPVSAEEDVIEALKEGDLELDLRYRYEYVDEEGFDRNANASTIRLLVGYETGTYYGLRLKGSLQGNQDVGDDRFNSTQNGRTDFPVVPDPADIDFNEAYLAYSGIKGTDFILGRQRINLENQRHFGSVAWRQLEQTFNGFAVKSETLDRWEFFYGHLGKVNKVQGRNNPNDLLNSRDLSTDVLEVRLKLKPLSIKGYAHLNEYEDPATMPPLSWMPTAEFSFQNLGVRLAGKAKIGEKSELVWAAEYAKQSDYRDALSIVDADYYVLDLTAKLARVSIQGQVEVLGGDGLYGFQTPFATLWKFNGWTDRFLVTPTTGLQDYNLTVSGAVKGLKLLGRYHYFSADTSAGKYGDEVEFGAVKGFKGGMFQVGLRAAVYTAAGDPANPMALRTFERDTTKIWLWGTFRL